MRIILGSESPWRKQLLTEMGYQFDVLPPKFDEKSIRDNRPDVLTLKLAEAKNKALRAKLEGGYLLITADQVIAFNGKIREKPDSYAMAYKYLRTIHHHPSISYTAVAVYNSTRQYFLADVDVAKIYFKRLTKRVIVEMIDQGDVLKCAGGFTCEHPLAQPFITKIIGDMDSIQGLPKKMTVRLIEKVS